MRYKLVKLYNYSILFNCKEFSSNLFLFFVRQRYFDIFFSFLLWRCLVGLSWMSSIGSVRSFCVYTGRSRGVYRFFGCSSLMLRIFVSLGVLVGVSRFIW